MKNILFLIVLLFSSCALRPEKLKGTYSGTCDGTPVSIKLPENGLWQLSKDTIIIFEQNGNAVSNFVVPKDTFIVKRVLFPKKKNCYLIKD
ncbi:MAG: hypothetical protein IPF63_02850 [Bacteroidetes bacterium]|nr:hypothetical protein [Bacteroidota bacterium]